MLEKERLTRPVDGPLLNKTLNFSLCSSKGHHYSMSSKFDNAEGKEGEGRREKRAGGEMERERGGRVRVIHPIEELYLNDWKTIIALCIIRTLFIMDGGRGSGRETYPPY